MRLHRDALGAGLAVAAGMTPMLSSLIWLIAFAVGFVWMARRYRRRAQRTELQFERDVLARLGTASGSERVRDRER